MKKSAKPTRADARQSMKQILATAERILDEDPQATLLQIAEASGLTRVTIYRHFKNRAELLETLTREAFLDSLAVIEKAHADRRSFDIVLKDMTLALLKSAARWRAIAVHPGQSKAVIRYRNELFSSTDKIMRRGVRERAIDRAIPIHWARHTYIALVKQAKTLEKELGLSTNELSEIITRTFLTGTKHV